MISITPEEVFHLETRRLIRAHEQGHDYELNRAGDSEVFVVRRGETAYVTTPHSCSCPDAKHRKLTCKHQWLARSELDAAEAPAPDPHAQARKDRELLWD